MITLSENFRALFYAPFYAAHAIGAYAAEGVGVTLRPSANPSHTAADLRAGRIDVMWGGPLRVLLNHAADPRSDVVCFCDVVARDPFFVLGRHPRPNFRPSDLAGLRLGSVSEVSTPWLCLQDDIRRDGGNPSAVTRVMDGTMEQNVVALREERLDAVQLFQPHVETLLASGAGHLWHAAATRGLTAYTTLVTRRSVLNQRRPEMLGLVRAMYRTLRWIRVTSGAEIAQVIAHMFPDVPPAILAPAIDRYRALDLYSADPITRREGFDRLAASMRSGGSLDQVISFGNCIDNSLAEQVVREGI